MLIFFYKVFFMTKNSKLEVCRDIDSIIRKIDEGVEGLTETTRQIMRKRLVEAVYETEKPDGYYPTMNRIVNAIMPTVFTAIVIIFGIAQYIIYKSYGLSANYLTYTCIFAAILIFTVGIIVIWLFKNSDKITESILRSDNLTLRKILIPQNK